MLKGLSTKEVNIRLKQYGYNEIKDKKEYKSLKILLSQFTSTLIIVLTLAGLLSILIHETLDGIAILAIVIINAVIGFIQEYKADNAINALKKLVVQKTIAIRNHQQLQIPIRELVPDDIVVLSEGDKIPADLKIIESYSLQVDESMLTGESSAKDKQEKDMLYKGTIITTGRATAKVINTGINTEFGKIIDLVSKQNKTQSPLSKQLDTLGKKLGIIVSSLIALVFIIGYLKNISPIEMLMTSIALGVSAIPEGMPIIVTLTLAIAVQALANKNAIIRKMNAVETLGATTIICSDKTGTLTLNEMTVTKINTNFTEKLIPGLGYKTNKTIKLQSIEEKKLLEICENCNNSFVGKNTIGDPTEISLKILTRKAKYVKDYKEIDEKTFTSERKMMSTLNKVGKDKVIYSKGAFEEIIKRSTHIIKNGKVQKITPEDKQKYKTIANNYAKEALRVLGFAYKPYKDKFNEEGLIFVGVVGIIDPPRKEVSHSLKMAQEAGIEVKIITGDNPITAKAIGKQIGLNTGKVITGNQIDRLKDSELIKVIKNTTIFARTKPNHKYRIVNLLKKHQEVVAVTGDGVNDAPALKHADVGIAMGIKGTEATKEVADIVLKDDNFATIVNTIKEGRRIYHNILSFIKYMLSANFDTIMAVALITLIGLPMPILPLQILWINLATDALPALALGNSPADTNIMKAPPRKKNEKILKKFIVFIMTAALLQTIVNLFTYFYGTSIDTSLGIDLTNLSLPSHTRTLVFTQIVLFELLFVFTCKEEKQITIKSLTSNKTLILAVLISLAMQVIMIYTPIMQTIFKTVPLTLKEWLILLLFASTAFLVAPISNIIKKKTNAI